MDNTKVYKTIHTLSLLLRDAVDMLEDAVGQGIYNPENDISKIKMMREALDMVDNMTTLMGVEYQIVGPYGKLVAQAVIYVPINTPTFAQAMELNSGIRDYRTRLGKAAELVVQSMLAPLPYGNFLNVLGTTGPELR